MKKLFTILLLTSLGCGDATMPDRCQALMEQRSRIISDIMSYNNSYNIVNIDLILLNKTDSLFLKCGCDSTTKDYEKHIDTTTGHLLLQ